VVFLPEDYLIRSILSGGDNPQSDEKQMKNILQNMKINEHLYENSLVF
jgi:hypothetical protein